MLCSHVALIGAEASEKTNTTTKLLSRLSEPPQKKIVPIVLSSVLLMALKMFTVRAKFFKHAKEVAYQDNHCSHTYLKDII